MHAVIVAGSSLRAGLDAVLLEEADLLIAVDGGADALATAGLVPSVLVGDMDSVAASTRGDFEAAVSRSFYSRRPRTRPTPRPRCVSRSTGAPTRSPCSARSAGPAWITWSATSFCSPHPGSRRSRVRMVDDLHEVFLVEGDVIFAGRPGDIVSLLPLTPRVEDVRTLGLLYPLPASPSCSRPPGG